ncbi:hypothetical protein BDAP_000762 [Binucleata daphniae]
MISFKKITCNATLPQRHSKEAAGYDLYCNESGTIQPKNKKVVRTGIVLNVPENNVAMIYGRSGLSNKYLLEVTNNCVYPGNDKEVLLHFYNNGDVSCEYKTNERVAQVIFVEVATNTELVYI